jgi:hypothetical protein
VRPSFLVETAVGKPELGSKSECRLGRIHGDADSVGIEWRDPCPSMSSIVEARPPSNEACFEFVRLPRLVVWLDCRLGIEACLYRSNTLAEVVDAVCCRFGHESRE